MSLILLSLQKPRLRGKALFSFPLQSFPLKLHFCLIGKGWLNSPWMFVMALMRLRPMHLTLLSPRGRFALCVNNSDVKYRVSVSQSTRHLAFHKTVIAYNVPSKHLTLTISTWQLAVKTLVLPTAVNSLFFHAFSTNQHFSSKSQNGNPSISNKKGTALVPACLGLELIIITCLPLVHNYEIVCAKKAHCICMHK